MAGRQSDIDTMLLLSGRRRRRRHTFTEKYCWILIKLNLKEFMRGDIDIMDIGYEEMGQMDGATALAQWSAREHAE